MITTYQKFYRETVVPQLMKEFQYDNIMQVPKITKITVNMGLGEAVTDKKIIGNGKEDLAKIVGQQAITTLARKSIAGFKIREEWPLGCKVTLRRNRMYEFLERLICIAIYNSDTIINYKSI